VSSIKAHAIIYAEQFFRKELRLYTLFRFKFVLLVIVIEEASKNILKPISSVVEENLHLKIYHH